MLSFNRFHLYEYIYIYNARERTGMCTRFWWESQKERDHLKDQGIDGKMGSDWLVERGVFPVGSG
jgi:hypothetical protein